MIKMAIKPKKTHLKMLKWSMRPNKKKNREQLKRRIKVRQVQLRRRSLLVKKKMMSQAMMRILRTLSLMRLSRNSCAS